MFAAHAAAARSSGRRVLACSASRPSGLARPRRDVSETSPSSPAPLPGWARAFSSSEETVEVPVDELDPSSLADAYNRRRAVYNRSVSALRKQYHAEFVEQRERESRAKARETAKVKRAALERKRLKAMRTAENARAEVERRRERHARWTAELEATQRERDAKKDLYRRARQRIVDELEAECHLWLTSAEEVEAALGSPAAGQALWSRPGGLIGAPSGPDTAFGDHDFWRYESHTFDSRPTYKTPKEVMLENFEELAYLQANKADGYWTEDRVAEAEAKEQRARLRAVVREEGRRSLLNKQRELMRDAYRQDNSSSGKGGTGRLPPTAMPAPNLDYLADYEAQEREGAKILLEDPARFFYFERDLPGRDNIAGLHASEQASEDAGDGPAAGGGPDATASSSGSASLGRPVGLRNPFYGIAPFPLRMGRELPKDTRTEKEKKRDERQERMRAAAEEAAVAARTGTSYEVAMAAEEDLEDGSEDVDYDAAEEAAEKELWAEQEGEWDETDRRVFEATPPKDRITTEEVDWLIERLQAKADSLKERLDFDEKMRRREVEARAVTAVESIDDVDRDTMIDLGYDMAAVEDLIRGLTPEQTSMLEGIDFAGREGVTAEQMAAELSGVPGLSVAQIEMLVAMEMRALADERLKKATGAS